MKHSPIRSKKLRDSARGQACTLEVYSVCNGNPETTVLAHIQTMGGGMGTKADDISACFACSSCHEWLDQHKGTEEDELFYTRRALVKTHIIWHQTGVIKI